MKTKRILIVDDDPNTVAGLAANLEHLGDEYIVEFAASGNRAVTKLENAHYALVITDLRMPGIDGWELVKQARIINSQTRIIVMSGYPSKDIETKIAEYGIFGYIAKPFSIQFLLNIVHDALQGTEETTRPFRGYSDACLEKLSSELAELRQVIGARCIVLADSRGQLIAREGYSEGIDLATLLALVAGGFATAAEMARCLGDEHALNLNFHEGVSWDIYATSLSSEIVLVMLFDKKSEQQSRIGMVWLYAKRSIRDLLEIVQSDIGQQYESEIDKEFKDSLSKGLDGLFEASAPGASVPASEGVSLVIDEELKAEECEPGKTLDEADTIPLGEAIKRGLIPEILLHQSDDEGGVEED